MNVALKWIVAGLGLVLLGLLFAPWYDVDWSRFPVDKAVHVAADGSEYQAGYFWTGDLTGWGTVGLVSLLIALLAVAGILQALVVRGVRRPWVDRALSVATVVVGLAVVARMIWPPDALLVPAWGAWACLGTLLAILTANGMDSIARR